MLCGIHCLFCLAYDSSNFPIQIENDKKRKTCYLDVSVYLQNKTSLLNENLVVMLIKHVIPNIRT